MSWNAGVRLFRRIIETLYEHVDDDEARHSIYLDLIEEFEEFDCNNLRELYNETDDPAFDDAFCETHPDCEHCRLETDEDEDEDY